MPILSMRSVCNERHSLRIDMALVLTADSPDLRPARVRRLPCSESKLSLSIAGRANRGRSATPASLLKAAARAQPPLFSPHHPSPAPLSSRQRDGESDCPSRPWGDPHLRPPLYVASRSPARRCHLRAIQVQPSSASPPAVLLWRTCRFNGPYGLTRPLYVFASVSSLVRGTHPASFVLTNNTALRVRGADRVQSRAAPRYMRVAVSCSSVAASPCYCLGCQSGAAPF